MLGLQAVASLTPFQAEYLLGLFDDYLPGALEWVRSAGRELVPSVDVNLAATTARILQVRRLAGWLVGWLAGWLAAAEVAG